MIGPVADLRPPCSRCHTMVPRWRPYLGIEQLQSLVGQWVDKGGPYPCGQVNRWKA